MDAIGIITVVNQMAASIPQGPQQTAGTNIIRVPNRNNFRIFDTTPPKSITNNF